MSLYFGGNLAFLFKENIFYSQSTSVLKENSNSTWLFGSVYHLDRFTVDWSQIVSWEMAFHIKAIKRLFHIMLSFL